jgi:hypothetical protein
MRPDHAPPRVRTYANHSPSSRTRVLPRTPQLLLTFSPRGPVASDWHGDSRAVEPLMA